ncbi:DinB family protein [Dietzia cinnamea]|uniref:DinB family protein n=1 Tax=Dietzia cinnamea TaxID=321318 RepID=UPI0021A8A3CF|nr:DinB family protein [Dietzia cinnamea]MCT1638911.1 DinB family protein [Dietzia cinnamea]
MVTADAVHLILADQVVPTLRAVVADLGGDGPGTLVHTRPTPESAAWPTNSAAATVHHLCGVVASWGAACLGGEDVTRDRDAEFDYSGPVGPELDRLAALVGRLPAWAAAAVERGDLAHPTGTAFDVDAARRAGTLTVEWVLGHILHDLATHTGHLELTRDVLLARGRRP